MNLMYQATQIRLVSPQAPVEELCSSKADQSCRPGYCSLTPQMHTWRNIQVEWSVLKLHWVAKELLLKSGANLQVKGDKSRALENYSNWS